jgi:hypothetical protein
MSNGQFNDGLRRGAWSIHHGNSGFSCRSKIDVVDANTGSPNDCKTIAGCADDICW